MARTSSAAYSLARSCEKMRSRLSLLYEEMVSIDLIHMHTPAAIIASPKKQFATRSKIRDEVKLLARLEAIAQLHNERVINGFEDGPLSFRVVDLVTL